VLYSSDDYWFLCNDWSATHGGELTVIDGEADLAKRSADLFEISAGTLDGEVGGQAFAGGAMDTPAMKGVTGVSYEFPDGHTVKAEINDSAWVMSDLFTDREQPLQEEPSDPVKVTVTLSGGATETYELG
jgi:hypothetical protein